MVTAGRVSFFGRSLQWPVTAEGYLERCVTVLHGTEGSLGCRVFGGSLGAASAAPSRQK